MRSRAAQKFSHRDRSSVRSRWGGSTNPGRGGWGKRTGSDDPSSDAYRQNGVRISASDPDRLWHGSLRTACWLTRSGLLKVGHALAHDPVLANSFRRPRSASYLGVARSRNEKSSTIISGLAPSIARPRSWAWALHQQGTLVSTRSTISGLGTTSFTSDASARGPGW